MIVTLLAFLFPIFGVRISRKRQLDRVGVLETRVKPNKNTFYSSASY